MTLSGALAGLMATNEILGGQHRVILGFSGGYGFAGIAVALMGRNHPVGIVLAALLFGALYQGGTELAFEMPRVNNDLVVVIQGLVILFAGALENMFRPQLEALFARRPARGGAGLMLDERRLPAPPDAGQHDPARGTAGAGGHGRAVLRARRRGRHRPRGQDAGGGLRRRGRGADHRQRLARRAGRDGCSASGLAMIHGFASITHRGDQVVSGMALNVIAAGLGPTLADAWFGQAGRVPVTAEGARFAPIDLPFAEAARDIPILGPIYAELISGHNILVYVTALLGAAGRLGGLPHPLRPAPAGGRREPGRGRHGRHLGRRHALPGADGRPARLCGIAGAYLSIAQSAGFTRDMTAGKGYLALAALIFGKWRPVPALLACLLFAFTDALAGAAAGRAAACGRRGPGPADPGAALSAHHLPARRLRRQVGGAQGDRHPLRQGAMIAVARRATLPQ